MISRAGRWTQTPSVTPLQPKKWNACFCIMFNFWWSAGLVDGLESHLPPLSSQKNEILIFVLHSTSDDWAGHWTWTPSTCPLKPKKWNAHFWIIFNFWWSAALVNGLQPNLPPLSRHKMKFSFLHYVQLVMIVRAGHGLKPHLPPLSSQIMQCSFLDYVQLLMIDQAGQWTRTPSATPLQPKKWYAHFWITFNFLWSARLAEGLQPHLQPLCNQKMKCLFLYYVIVQMISRVGRWTQNPSTTPQAKKMKC